MKQRQRKRSIVAAQRAWIAHPLRWQVQSGRYRDVAAPRRGPKFRPFMLLLHSDGSSTRVF